MKTFAFIVALFAAASPLAKFEKTTRTALRRGGLVKHTANDLVWFTGGKGTRTVVLVHGVNEQAGTWSTVAPQLERDFRVVALDLPDRKSVV